MYAFAEAVDYLDVARAQIQARSPEAACLRSRLDELAGDNLESIARHDAAVTRYIEARRRVLRGSGGLGSAIVPADSLHVEDVEARDSDLCRKIAVALERRHAEYRKALRWLDRAMQSLPPGRPALEARLRVTRSVVEFRLGNYQASLSGGEEGLELARRVGDEALQAYALAMLANPCVGLGLIPRAIEASEEAVALYARVGDLAGQASGEANLAACYQLAGDLRAALEHQELALLLHQRLGYQTGMAICHTNLGEVLTQIGRVDEAIGHLERVVDGWKGETIPAALMGFALVTLSRALLLRGELDRAAEALEKGRGLLRHADAQGLLLEAELQLAELEWAQDRARDAEERCLVVLNTARATEARILEARCLYLLGRLATAREDAAAATEHLCASAAVAAEIGARYEHGLALLELARVDSRWLSRDRSPQSSLAEAITLFETMGAERELAKARELRDRLT
jgi:tetratricopeptide (TPR) repeat protein